MRDHIQDLFIESVARICTSIAIQLVTSCCSRSSALASAATGVAALTLRAHAVSVASIVVAPAISLTVWSWNALVHIV